MNKNNGVSEQTPKDDSPVMSSRTWSAQDSDVSLQHFMGNAVSHEKGRLSLEFVSVQESLVVSVDKSVVLGRGEQGDSDEVKIDLVPYGASDMGVSRRHARLHRTTTIIYITDLKSLNGTFLNGERLSPHQARILRDGDEVHLGKLLFHVHIQ